MIFEDYEDLLEISQPAKDVILIAVIPFRNPIEFADDETPEKVIVFHTSRTCFYIAKQAVNSIYVYLLLKSRL